MSAAVVTLSSGLDSSVSLAIARAEGREIPLALTFDYGQRAARRETEAAARLAARFGVTHRVVRLPWIAEFPGALTGRGELPLPRSGDLEGEASVRSAGAVWVPNRNGVFLEVAAGFAEALGADEVLVGFNREEAATFPDNSAAYVQALNVALGLSTRGRVRIASPTLFLDKREIVARAKRMDFPFELLWSCYIDGPRMCGRCESCQRLKRALIANEVATDALFDDPALC